MMKENLINYLKNQEFPDSIINAFKVIDRRYYVPEEFESQAYANIALPIGYGQTISQPYTIAFMLMLLELKDNIKILEVGSGSGYVLDLINNISKNSQIYGIERIKDLVDKSKKVLKSKSNINIIFGDGSKGLIDDAPFDRILVSASSDKIPQKILDQLTFGGILVIPVKDKIVVVKKNYRENVVKEYSGFVFVPLIDSN
ncbi:MAG: protein-L-isoaspartate O-methyltransferase [Nanoarchaeota archaeon]